MSARIDQSQNSKVEFVTLVAGGQSFCIEITQIREIRRWSPVTILPHAPRVRTHNQNMTVAARAIADKKTFGQRS